MATDQELTFALYFEAHPEELPRWEMARKQFIDSHSNVSFWGYDEKQSDIYLTNAVHFLIHGAFSLFPHTAE